MANTFHLSFSISPVQGFVAQARRTRDLWAGSWLLSYLAESALVEAENAGGRTIIPHREEAQRGIVTSKQSPVGGMPNRFEVRFEGDDAKQLAIAAAKAADVRFRNAWQKVAAAVFDQYVQPVLDAGNGTADIWQTQVNHFWELSWVVGEADGKSGTISHLAALRKNFRNVPASPEPGTKCALMPDLQEISGYFGTGTTISQYTFWKRLRDQKGIGRLNLAENERLSAIALIKRLFPVKAVLEKALGNDVTADLHQVGWPSTAFVAALPWLQRLPDDAKRAAEVYQDAAFEHGYSRSETEAARGAKVNWAIGDGPIWFTNGVRNDEPRQSRIGSDPTPAAERERDAVVRRLLQQLQQVYRHAAEPGESGSNDRQADKSCPVPYYALLLMDGDSLGTINISPDERAKSLNRFAQQVRDVVEDESVSGRTVYAGGDDILAFVPAAAALETASVLRKKYHEAFAYNPSATISAAIVYAPWRYPLRQVLRTAHHLLDDIAKDATGRDAVALGIVLGSGLNAVWAVPWDVFHGTAKTKANDPCVALRDMLYRFGADEVDESDDPPFNASYLYLLRERFTRLFGDWHEEPGQYANFAMSDSVEAQRDEDVLRDLAHGEYRRRMSKKMRIEKQASETEPLIDHLMSLSRRWRRTMPGGQADENGESRAEITCDRTAFSFDGWRVARFLKQINDGKVTDHD